MGHLFGVHGSCLRDAVGGAWGFAVQDALHFPHGAVHADMWIFQPSCSVDAVRSVHQEESAAAACANGGVCVPEPLVHAVGDRQLPDGLREERGYWGHVVPANAVCLLRLCLARAEAARYSVVENHREHSHCAFLPTRILLAIQLYAHILLDGICIEET